MTKKRITAFLLMLVMLMTSVSVAFAENAEETAPISETPLEVLDTEAFHALYAMGFVGDELLNTDKNTFITRAQFTGWLFKLSGYSLTEYDASGIPFGDVSILTPYYNEICTMYEMGVVNGTEPKRFSPDAHVTYAQACKLIIDVLGYRNYAEIKYGEFPEGYVMMAGELDIDDGVKDVKWNKELTAENAATMLFNAGEAEVLAFSGTDKNGNPTYDTDGRTLFQKGNDIYSAKGTLQSSGICSIIGEEPRDGIIIIDGISFECDKDFSDLVGCKVDYFYRDDSVSKTLLWAAADSRFSNILTLDAKDLIPASPDYTLTNVVYYGEDGDQEFAKLASLVDVIYNNSRCGIPSIEDIKPATGSMRLIDDNDDEIYDVVIVNEYQNMFVIQAPTDGQQLVGKYGKRIDLDKYENVVIKKDGTDIEPDKIGINVLISYIENKEKTRIHIYVQSEKKEDAIKTTRVSRGRTLYGIGEEEFRLSATYQKILDDGEVYAISPVTGNEYTFYFDMDGEIAEIQKSKSGGKQYALLMSVRTAEPYEDADAYARLLLADGSKISGVIDKKVNVNGTKKTGAEFLADTRLKDDKGKFRVQVVQVTFNNEGVLATFDFANDIRAVTDPETGEDLYPYGFDSDNFSLDYSDSGRTTMSKNGGVLCNNRYIVTPDTVIFAKWDDDKSAEPYEVKAMGWFGIGTYYKELYDVSSDMTVGAVYRTGLSRKTNWLTSAMLVEEIDYIYENDQEVKRISGYMTGKRMSYAEYEPGVLPEDLKRGDLIYISHQDNKITNISYVMRAEEFTSKEARALKLISGSTPATCDVEEATCFAPIYNVSNRGITVFTPSKWENYCGKIMTGVTGNGTYTITVYDIKNDEMYIGDKNDVFQLYSPDKKGDVTIADDSVMVYLRLGYMEVKEMILVRY